MTSLEYTRTLKRSGRWPSAAKLFWRDFSPRTLGILIAFA